MGIIKDFFNNIKKRRESAEEIKFNNMDPEKKQAVCDEILNANEETQKSMISKKPYILPHIIADLSTNNVVTLIDIATKKGVNVYDLIDKNSEISNTLIVNIAVANQPELVLELDDMPALQDLITTDVLIEAFTKNPEVLFSSCKALNSRITLRGSKKDGEKSTRTATLKSQLQRAMNLYFRPETMQKNGFDDFAMQIASRIDSKQFMQKVYGNKMTTRSITAANEMIKKAPEKASVVPAKALHNWNNRVLYTLPNSLRKKLKESDVKYEEFEMYLLGLLKNPSLNSFTVAEKARLFKRCVSIVPEVYLDMADSQEYKDVLNKLTVQLTAYESFKKQHKDENANLLLSMIGEDSKKKVLARTKANETRKNKSKKVAKQEKELTL